MASKTLKYSSVALMTLLLASCGEGSGWERILTDQMFPYGNQRTAGSGVAYVLAKMMPEKELKLERAPEAQSIDDLMRAVDRKIEPQAIKSSSSMSAVVTDVQKTLNKTLRK